VDNSFEIKKNKKDRELTRDMYSTKTLTI